MWHWIIFIIIFIALAYYLAYKRTKKTLRGDVSSDKKTTSNDEKTPVKNKEIIKIVYINNKDGVDIKKKVAGNEFISPDMAINQPHVRWRGQPEEGKKYTLVMVDPDSKYKEWRHWCVINIPDKNPKNGVQISPYKPPQPPKGSGEHKYIFKWYEQSGDLSPTMKFDEFPGNWSSDAFASENNLKLLGYTQFRSATI